MTGETGHWEVMSNLIVFIFTAEMWNVVQRTRRSVDSSRSCLGSRDTPKSAYRDTGDDRAVHTGTTLC